MCKNLNILIKTSPSITSQDRKRFAELALGNNISGDFYSSVNLKSTENSFEESVTGPSTQPLPLVSSETVIIPSAHQNEENMKKEIDVMKLQFNRLSEILQTDTSTNNLMIIKKLNKVLCTIETVDQAKNFAIQRIKMCRSRKIGVQPTSVSRRKDRGISKGKGRIQSGRDVRKKKQHNLSENINKNQPNAKKH